MNTVFLATLGQRPEAITVAFDRLRERHDYEAIGVLHTNREASGIAEAYTRLYAVLKADYPGVRVFWHEIVCTDGSPLLDVTNQDTANAYHKGVFAVLNDYRKRDYHQHLLISGGRKAMAAYALSAASYAFTPPHDKCWVVLSDERLMSVAGRFHAGAGEREQVQMVELPLLTARLMPGSDAEAVFQRHDTPREGFLHTLSRAERCLCDMLQSYPHADSASLGELLSKSPRTVEAQLASIYNKMCIYFENPMETRNKRGLLMDILRG